MNTTFPKILIINYSAFNEFDGGAITLSNLFYGWPSDKLAIMHTDPRGTNPTKTHKSFRLPRKICLPGTKIGLTWQTQKDICFDENKKNSSAGKPNIVRTAIRNIINSLGIAPLLEQYVLTKKMADFIKRYKPDIIYTQLGNIAFGSFVFEISKKYHIPIAVHIMDDYPSALYKKGMLSIVARRRMHRQLINIFSYASIRMGICQAMCDEYSKRYGVNFIPFHNPIDLSVWNTHSGRSIEISNSQFKIIYSGRIGVAANSSINDICNVVRSWEHDSISVVFDVYVNDITSAKNNAPFLSTLPNNIRLLQAPTNVDDLASILSMADCLLFPVDFEKDAVDYIRLSMPTKVPVYMASGRPILAYGPIEVASIHYAKTAGWGYIVEKRSPDLIKAAILRLAQDSMLRKTLSNNAKQIAASTHSATTIRENFRLALCQGVV